MYKLADIIRENDATFYDYRTGIHRSTLPRFLLTALAAAVSAIIFSGDITAFIGSLITVQAVLVGFAFSVIFFILSAPPPSLPNPDSIEDRLAVRRAERLGNELFSNVSYFVFVGMAGLAFAMFLLVPDIPSFLWSMLSKLKTTPPRIIPDVMSVAGRIAIVFLTAFLTIESAYTFARTVGRVWFLFSERARLSGHARSGT